MTGRAALVMMVLGVSAMWIFTPVLAGDFHDISSMRCGSKIINIGATKYDVQASCGEPASIEQGAPYSEVWVYNAGSDSLIYYLTFEGLKLSRIQTGDRGK